MFRAGVQGENYFNYTARVKSPPTQVPAEDEGSPALWCHCWAPLVYQNSHQEHTPDQWTHTDLKCSEERRQQTLKWGRRLIDGDYQRLRVGIRSVFGSFAPRGVHVEVKAGAQALSHRVAPESKSVTTAGHLAHFHLVSLGFLRSRRCRRVTLRSRSPSSFQLRYQPSRASWSLIEVCAPAAIELWAC